VDFGKSAAITTTPIPGRKNDTHSKRTLTDLVAASRFLP
jgi:hypothetical protein